MMIYWLILQLQSALPVSGRIFAGGGITINILKKKSYDDRSVSSINPPELIGTTS